MTDDAPAAEARAGWPDLAWRLAYRLAHRLLRAWWRLRRPGARGVGVAVWHGGRLLVVRTCYRRRLLALPGGGVGRGEDPRAAALRELREEVGIAAPAGGPREVARLRFVLEHRAIEDTIFEWRPAARPPVRPDGREVVWAGWLTPAEIDAAAPVAPGLAGYLAGASPGARPQDGADAPAATPAPATGTRQISRA